MRSHNRLLAPLSLLLSASFLVPLADGQSTTSDLKPTEVSEKGTIENVVLYRGRAAVTRVIRRNLAQGLWAIKVSDLPATAQQQSLQAKVSRDGSGSGSVPKLLSVEYAQKALAEFGGTPEGVALANKLKDLQRQLEYLKQDDAQADMQLKLIDQIGVRATANATNDGGTQALSLDNVRQQLEFVAKERARVVELKRSLVTKAEDLARQIQATQAEFNARGGADRVERAAVVVVAVAENTPVEIDLTYVVEQATWEPAYNIRAAGDRTGVEIEYDAMISQATGEDWTDIKLALSTAQPTRASAPPPVSPWFVDVYVPPPPAPAAPPVAGTTGGFAMKRADAEEARAYRYAEASENDGPMSESEGSVKLHLGRKIAIDNMTRGADVQETGTAVSFELPRALSVPTDSTKKQRTRIASVAPTSTFVYTAQPIVTEDLYLRGDLTNSSSYQLLPGRAQIFMGGDFIGETGMPSVAPKDEFKVYFGPDRALHAKRLLVNKTTGASGFFGGSQTTTWNYRITIDNGSGRDAKVELYDRQIVSRNDKITVALTNLSKPLSTDKPYLETLATQGILRWDLVVPAAARGDAAMPITWNMELTRANKVETTPLPND